MPLLEVVTPWGSQPQEPADIDWSNPISRGLVSLLADIDGRAQSFVGPIVEGAGTAGAAKVATAAGIGPNYRGTGGTDWHTGPDIGLANQTEVTIVALVVRTGAASEGFSGPISLGTSASTVTACLEPGTNSYDGDQVYFSVWSSAGTRTNMLVSSGAKLAPLNTPQVVALRVGASTISGFYDGSKLASQGGPTTLRTFGALQKGRSQIRKFNGVVPFAACWNRALSDAEIASISANPWQLFTRREWVPVAASGGGGAASLTVTESGADTASASASAAIQGSASIAESGTDAASASGTVTPLAGSASLLAVEAGADAAAGVARAQVNAACAATESGEDFGAGGAVATVVVIQAGVESGSDTAAASAKTLIFGSAAALESGADSIVITAGSVVPPAFASLAALEAGADTFAGTATAQLPVSSAALAVVEAGVDQASGAAGVALLGTMLAAEAAVQDGMASMGGVLIRGAGAAVELGSDMASGVLSDGSFVGPSVSASRRLIVPAEIRRRVIGASGRRLIVSAQ